MTLDAAAPGRAGPGGGVCRLPPRRGDRADEATTLAAAGALLRRLVAAFRAMDADRVRARAELGVAPAPISGDANPIARAGSAEQALALLLAPPQAG